MCGITGIVNFSRENSIDKNQLIRATRTLEKRGPNNQSTFIENNVGLGHARLSIIDTSEKGNQPITDSSGRFTIVFNGEFYNYQEHKEILESEGVIFQSNTDTEVLLQLYIKHGEKCLEYVNGFFAFAIYDKKEETLFIARDRMGIKPLLYYIDDSKLVFASEMKAILQFGIQKNIDDTALFTYLQLNYIASPKSILKKVKKLLPGHCVKFSTKALTEITPKPYYSILQSCTKLNYDSAQLKLKELLENSVQKRLIADVPLGCFLSGGIDSSVITAIASKHVKDLQTFSIGYSDNPFFDETYYANLVAKKHQTNHTVFSLSNQDLLEHLDDVLSYLDEPFADSSAIPVYILSKLTKEHVTVSLSGDGADELFSGYNKHSAEYKARNSGLIGKSISLLTPLLKCFPQSRSGKVSNLNRQLIRFGNGVKLPPQYRYWQWASYLNEKEAQDLLVKQDFASFNDYREQIISNISKKGDFNEVLLTDSQLLLENDMLRKVDLMSMANSLEVRTPFLDHSVVNFAFSLPTSYKIDSKRRKKILIDTYKNELPVELFNRPKKGFEVPLLSWFTTSLKSKIENEYLKDSFIKEQNIFNIEDVKALKRKLFSNNPGDSHATIWALIVFQNWYKKYYINA